MLIVTFVCHNIVVYNMGATEKFLCNPRKNPTDHNNYWAPDKYFLGPEHYKHEQHLVWGELVHLCINIPFQNAKTIMLVNLINQMPAHVIFSHYLNYRTGTKMNLLVITGAQEFISDFVWCPKRHFLGPIEQACRYYDSI